MAAITLEANAEIEKRIQELANQTIESVEMQDLIKHVHRGIVRFLENPVVMRTEGKTKIIEILEHYRAERDENDQIRLSIKYGRAEDKGSVFVPYSYSEHDLKHSENLEWGYLNDNPCYLGSYKWIFDLPLDSSSERFNSFTKKDKYFRGTLGYVELACIIKMAEYLNILEYIDHDFLMYMTDQYDEEYRADTKKYRKLRWWFYILYKGVSEYLHDYCHDIRMDWYANSMFNHTIKKHLKSMCSTRIRFLFDTLTKTESGMYLKKVKNTLRLSKAVYVSERFKPYTDRVKKLEKYSKAQLFYLLMFQDDIEQINNLNFFSHENMIRSNDKDDFFKFPNKKALKNFNKLDIGFLDKIFASQCKSGILEEWFISNTSERTGYSHKFRDERNQFAWEVLMTWLTHGESHVGIKNGKADESKIKLISQIMYSMYFHSQGDDMEGSFKAMKVNPQRLALTFDFCCTYVDHIEKELKDKKVFFEQKIAKAKEQYGEELFNRSELKYILKERIREALIPFEEEFGSKLDSLEDFLTHWDENWKTMPHLESTDRTTTVKSFERKINRWHDELNAYTPEELEKAKQSEYKNLKRELIEFKDCTFQPIQNRYELMIEGAEMRHCVAAFHWTVDSGKYIVLKALRGDERATLGIWIDNEEDKPFSFHQCYKKYNHHVSEEMFGIAKAFVEHLNREPKLILTA